VEGGVSDKQIPRYTVNEITVYAYTSEIDGHTVIEIDTHDQNDVPQCRVFLNDGQIYGKDPMELLPIWGAK
jgi:hypothetical protein